MASHYINGLRQLSDKRSRIDFVSTYFSLNEKTPASAANWISQHPFTEKSTKSEEKLLEWNKLSRVNFTPTILINNRVISSQMLTDEVVDYIKQTLMED